MTCDHQPSESCVECQPTTMRYSSMAGFDEAYRRLPTERSRIERYVRCSVEIPGGSVEVGLQYEEGEDTISFRCLMRDVVMWVLGPGQTPEVDKLTADLELEMSLIWPQRAWFVEVWNAAEALTQVFAPFGLPRTGVR